MALRMRVLSLNTSYGEHKPELRDFLSRQLHDTDIFCLQESVGENMEEMVAKLFDSSRFESVTAEKRPNNDCHYGFHTVVKNHSKYYAARLFLVMTMPQSARL